MEPDAAGLLPHQSALAFSSRERWKITCGGNPRTVCVSLKPEQGQLLLGVICFCKGSKEWQLLPVQSLALVPALHIALICCLLPIWSQSFWKEEANGIILFYCTQISYGLKFCMLKGCVGVCKGERTRDSSSSAVFVQQLHWAEVARLSQALKDA